MNKINKNLRVLPSSLNYAPQFTHDGNYPNAEMYGSKGFYLASGLEQSDQVIDFVINKINSFSMDKSFYTN